MKNKIRIGFLLLILKLTPHAQADHSFSMGELSPQKKFEQQVQESLVRLDVKKSTINSALSITVPVAMFVIGYNFTKFIENSEEFKKKINDESRKNFFILGLAMTLGLTLISTLPTINNFFALSAVKKRIKFAEKNNLPLTRKLIFENTQNNLNNPALKVIKN